MFKKLDFVIIAVLMILSFLPEILLGASVGKGFNNTYAEITVAGKLYETIPLSAHKGEEIIELKTDLGINIIKITDNKILDVILPVFSNKIQKVAENFNEQNKFEIKD